MGGGSRGDSAAPRFSTIDWAFANANSIRFCAAPIAAKVSDSSLTNVPSLPVRNCLVLVGVLVLLRLLERLLGETRLAGRGLVEDAAGHFEGGLPACVGWKVRVWQVTRLVQVVSWVQQGSSCEV